MGRPRPSKPRRHIYGFAPMAQSRSGSIYKVGGSLHSHEPPDQYIQSPGKMQKGLCIRQFDPRRAHHRVDFDLGERLLQGPGRVMDVSPPNLIPVHGVKAVALGQPMLNTSGLRKCHRCDRTIPAAKFRCGALSHGTVDDCLAFLFHLHVREKIWEAIERHGGRHGQPARRIQAEEIDPPRLPPNFTYVRTFNSANREIRGHAGVPRARTPLIQKGTTPTQHWSSKKSSSSSRGTSCRIAAAATGQWANNKSCQLCAITHGPGGNGHGRCATD